jgi:hypothetical protein
MICGGGSARADFEAPAGAQITWQTSGPGTIIHGSGCDGTEGSLTQDTWAISSGNDLSIVFTGLAISLPGNGSVPDLAQNKGCSVRLPVKVARGFYIGQLTQTLTVGATKSDNVDIDGYARSTFFGLPASEARVHAFAGPDSAFNFSALTATVNNKYLVTSFCKKNPDGTFRDLSGIYTSNLAVSGTRGSKQDNLLVGIDALDVSWDIKASLLVCT